MITWRKSAPETSIIPLLFKLSEQQVLFFLSPSPVSISLCESLMSHFSYMSPPHLLCISVHPTMSSRTPVKFSASVCTLRASIAVRTSLKIKHDTNAKCCWRKRRRKAETKHKELGESSRGWRRSRGGSGCLKLSSLLLFSSFDLSCFTSPSFIISVHFRRSLEEQTHRFALQGRNADGKMLHSSLIPHFPAHFPPVFSSIPNESRELIRKI